MSENRWKIPALIAATTLGFFGANEILKSPGNQPTYISGPESADGEETWIEIPARGYFSPGEFLTGLGLLGAAVYIARSVRNRKREDE